MEHIHEELEHDPTSEFYLTEREFVQEVCEKHERLGDDGHGSAETAEGEVHNLNLTGELLHKYLADLAEPCEDMLLRCHFEGR